MRQFLDGGLVLALGQEFDCELAPQRVGGVGQLRVNLCGRRGEGDLGQQRQVGVDPDDLRRLGQGEIIVFGELGDRQGVVDRLAVDLEPHR